MDGVIVINKPKNYTSHDVVSIVRKTINQKEVGHIGTLDPNATGVLPILIGKATKISKYLIDHDKEYVAILKLGEKKDTGDETGKTIEKETVDNYTIDDVKNALNSFVGDSIQTPSIYSAIKVNGKKLYEYAREGKIVEIPKRNIIIYEISLINYDNVNNEITFKIKCSKGTYIRTLCEDIALKLKTVGYMKELNRTKVDIFDIDNSIKLEDLDINNVKKRVISIEKVFEKSQSIELSNKDLRLFLNGVLLTKKLENDVYKIYNDNNFIGLGIIKDNLLKRDVII